MENLAAKNLLIGNAYQVLKTFSSPFLASTITSPPYLGKLNYGVEGQIGHETSVEAYFQALADVFSQVYRLTLPGGCLILNLGSTWNNYSPVRSRLSETKQTVFQVEKRRGLYPGYREKECIDSSLVIDRLRSIGWLHRDTWIWDKTKPGRKTNSDRPSSQHEYLYYFRKPTPGQRYKELYWDGSHLESSVIKVPAIGSAFHPCPFPKALVEPLILATTASGQTVLDPFGGLHTVADVAIEHGRNAISIDLKDYCEPMAS